VPVVGAHSATVAAGAAVTIDLMAGATGGPFIAAKSAHCIAGQRWQRGDS